MYSNLNIKLYKYYTGITMQLLYQKCQLYYISSMQKVNVHYKQKKEKSAIHNAHIQQKASRLLRTYYAVDKEFQLILHMKLCIYLTLSNNAYTNYSGMLISIR